MSFAPDCYERFSQVPNVTQSSLTAPEFKNIFRLKFLVPLLINRVGNYDSALCQQILAVSEAQVELAVEPNSVADDIRRIPTSIIARRSISCH